MNLEAIGKLTWDKVAPCVSSSMASVLEQVLAANSGYGLSRDECLLLGAAQADDLVGLCVAADELRRRLVGDVVTYVVNRNINFTNVCFVGCKFCAFAQGPREKGSYFLALDEIAEKTRQARLEGATEVCIQGGLPHDLPPFYYRDILRAVKSAVPEMHIHAFSPMEVAYGMELTGMDATSYLSMLKENGLGTMPGTAAEILNDDIRRVISRNKLTSAQWQEIVTAAHGVGVRTTSTLMYGHIEQTHHWVDQLLLLRRIQSDTGGFTEFVPLGFVHQNTLLFQQGHARPGPTVAEHLKIHALARVMLAGSINNIQVSWVKLSREVSQLCLQAGANDYGGTLMEENISRLAGATSGEHMTVAEFHARIRALGRVPGERNTTYSQTFTAEAQRCGVAV